jgi:hypothetical protein
VNHGKWKCDLLVSQSFALFQNGSNSCGRYFAAHPPPMHYDLTVLNAGSHLPEDLAAGL